MECLIYMLARVAFNDKGKVMDCWLFLVKKKRKCLWKRTLLGKHLRGERVKKVARFWKD